MKPRLKSNRGQTKQKVFTSVFSRWFHNSYDIYNDIYEMVINEIYMNRPLSCLIDRVLSKLFSEKMWHSSAELMTTQHVHNRIINAVEKKHVTQMRIDHNNYRAIRPESDTPVKSYGVASNWKCTHPKWKNINCQINCCANFEPIDLWSNKWFVCFRLNVKWCVMSDFWC